MKIINSIVGDTGDAGGFVHGFDNDVSLNGGFDIIVMILMMI